MDNINWLFLRGLTREKRHWGSFLDKFAEINPNDKILCLDLPGFGTETELSVPLSITDMADELRARWQHQASREQYQHNKNWGILGMSLGGMIALEWCAKHETDFQAGVIINSSASDLSSPTKRLRPERIIDLLRTRLMTNPTEREELIIKMTTRMITQINDKAREWGQYYKERPYASKNALKQLGAAAAFKSPKNLSIPLLFLSSEKDAFTHPECSVKLAKKYNAQHVQHAEAGHDLTTDDPVWVSQKIAEFKKPLVSRVF